MMNGNHKEKTVHKIVLTGGPCGGKTTSQARLKTFFEGLGWKVLCLPEAATTIIGCGIRWSDLNAEQVFKVQENIIKTMLQIEKSIDDYVESQSQPCLIICDRGVMDATAFLKPGDWEKMKELNHEWNEIDLRDNRYHQVIHMVTAAKGADAFYSIGGHKTRRENLEEAKAVDDLVSHAWIGHPYYDVIDNSTDFEEKIRRTTETICNRLGVDVGDRLAANAIKRKYLIATIPEDRAFPSFLDFDVVHDYLLATNENQVRLRKRGRDGHWSYTHTVRQPKINDQVVECRMNISRREYETLLHQRDPSHYTIFKKRRCFLWQNFYYQLDIYKDSSPARCHGLMILEVYSSKDGGQLRLPPFMILAKEITGNPDFSMFNLSRRGSDVCLNGENGNGTLSDSL